MSASLNHSNSHFCPLNKAIFEKSHFSVILAFYLLKYLIQLMSLIRSEISYFSTLPRMRNLSNHTCLRQLHYDKMKKKYLPFSWNFNMLITCSWNIPHQIFTRELVIFSIEIKNESKCNEEKLFTNYDNLHRQNHWLKIKSLSLNHQIFPKL